MARQCVIDAMDIHGGKAVMKGPGNYISSLYESVPVAITVEGANILTRNMYCNCDTEFDYENSHNPTTKSHCRLSIRC